MNVYGKDKILLTEVNPYGYIPVIFISTEPVYDSFWPNK